MHLGLCMMLRKLMTMHARGQVIHLQKGQCAAVPILLCSRQQNGATTVAAEGCLQRALRAAIGQRTPVHCHPAVQAARPSPGPLQALCHLTCSLAPAEALCKLAASVCARAEQQLAQPASRASDCVTPACSIAQALQHTCTLSSPQVGLTSVS